MTQALRTALPPLLLVVLLALAFVLPFQGTRHLWGTDEGRYSGVAAEMLDSGNWLVPHRHPEHEHLSKPPMTYWALAASMAAFGKNTWALRLPAALAFALTIACVFVMGKRLVPERPWWPPLVCAGTAMLFLAMNAISTDPLLCAFETLGMTGFVLAWRDPDERIARRGAWILGLGFGLAFLTKGPPGLVPLIPSLWFWWRNRKDFRANPFTWKTLLVWAPIALSWFVVVVWMNPARLGYFLGYETYGRIFTAQADRHPQWYGWLVAYGPVAAVGALPWTLVVFWDAVICRLHPRPLLALWQPLLVAGPFLVGAVGWATKGAIRPIEFALAAWLTILFLVPVLLWKVDAKKKCLLPSSRPQQTATDRSISAFLLCWMLISLVVFCISRSRLVLYVLPLLVPFALWAAHRTRHLELTPKGKILLTVWFLLLLAIKAALPHVHAQAFVGKDSQLLTDSIRQQVHEPISEVVFVDETALYGVRVYLGKPVLRVDYGDTTKPDVDESLAQALAEHRANRLWLVHMHTADNFAHEVAKTGAHARLVASFEHFRGFMVDPAAVGQPATPAQSTPAPIGQLTPVPPKPQ